MPHDMIDEYFEIYKLLKYLLLIVYFSLIPIKAIEFYIKPFFVLLCIFNLIHFFNLFDFNILLKYHYAGDLNIQYFGRDTLGNHVGKRMVGFMSNPNNNALVFLFFTIYFLPKTLKKENVKENLRIEGFKSKIQRIVRVENIEPFAKDYFGEAFKKATVKAKEVVAEVETKVKNATANKATKTTKK